MIVGTLDILAASLHYYLITGKNGFLVLNYVASGFFGNTAFTSGSVMMLYGLLFHYFIAICFALFFFWLSSKFPAILRHRVLTGVGFGVFIWSFMQFVILPLSNTPKRPFDPANAAISITILILCIGIPLAFLAPGAKTGN